MIQMIIGNIQKYGVDDVSSYVELSKQNGKKLNCIP